MDASDVNGAIGALAKLVMPYRLPPKVPVVHRFTTNMLQNAATVALDPRVQVVIDMDGWGPPWHKFDTYKTCEVDEPVQFTVQDFLSPRYQERRCAVVRARRVGAATPSVLHPIPVDGDAAHAQSPL